MEARHNGKKRNTDEFLITVTENSFDLSSTCLKNKLGFCAYCITETDWDWLRLQVQQIKLICWTDSANESWICARMGLFGRVFYYIVQYSTCYAFIIFCFYVRVGWLVRLVSKAKHTHIQTHTDWYAPKKWVLSSALRNFLRVVCSHDHKVKWKLGTFF